MEIAGEPGGGWRASRISKVPKPDAVCLVSESGALGLNGALSTQLSFNRYSGNATALIAGLGVGNIGNHTANNNLVFTDGHVELVNRSIDLQYDGTQFMPRGPF